MGISILCRQYAVGRSHPGCLQGAGCALASAVRCAHYGAGFAQGASCHAQGAGARAACQHQDIAHVERRHAALRGMAARAMPAAARQPLRGGPAPVQQAAAVGPGVWEHQAWLWSMRRQGPSVRGAVSPGGVTAWSQSGSGCWE